MTTGGRPADYCPFCAVVARDAPAREVLRTDQVVAFLPDVPAVLGHTLVVPRAHVRDIWELDRPTGHALADAIRRLAFATRAATGSPGLNIIQSNGAVAGQTVFHMHVHVVPRQDGDRMPDLWPADIDWPGDELSAVQDQLRAALGRDADT